MAANSKYDHLKWHENQQFGLILDKIGSPGEQIQYSGWADKINKRQSVQPRVLIITNMAVYNLKGAKCKRRIEIRNINYLIRSKCSHQFILCCPREYDYLYSSPHVGEILHTIIMVHRDLTHETLPIEYMASKDLFANVLTRQEAKDIKRSNPELVLANISAENTTGFCTNSNGEEVGPSSFRIVKILRKGGFAKVHLIQKHNSSEIFAMKVVSKDDLNKKMVERVKTEHHILQAAKHPFIVILRYAFQTVANLYIVMEYLNGGELFYHLKLAKKFKEDQIRFYAAEMVLAIGHLHSHDIIYRNLKPENLLLDSAGHLKLTNFGLAKRAILDNKSASTFSTSEYFAPEVISGYRHGRAADWWSLGMLVYEMFTGLFLHVQPPFYDKNTNIMYMKVLSLELTFEHYISFPAQDLLKKLLEKDPEKRLGSGPKDVQDIKDHEFFANIDWVHLYKKKIKSPFVPELKGPEDISNFDVSIISDPVSASLLNEIEGDQRPIS